MLIQLPFLFSTILLFVPSFDNNLYDTIIITSIHFTLRVRQLIVVLCLLIVYRFSLALSKLASRIFTVTSESTSFFHLSPYFGFFLQRCIVSYTNLPNKFNLASGNQTRSKFLITVPCYIRNMFVVYTLELKSSLYIIYSQSENYKV